MIDTVNANYALVASELPSLRTWINFQNSFGAGRKQISNADISAYMGGLAALSGAYPGLQNPLVKGYFDKLFDSITASNDAANMYLVWQFLGFTSSTVIQPAPAEASEPEGQVMPWISYWNVFAVTGSWQWKTPWYGSDDFSRWFSTLALPGAPAGWSSKVSTTLNQWGANPPNALINVGLDINSPGTAASFESSILQNWAGFTSLVNNTASVWAAQSNTVSAMLKEETLSADSYFLLLHLLIALTTSNTSDQQLAQKIVSTTVNSVEYPNDTIGNQIVYLSLMYFTDPLGDYGYTNTQLQSLLKDLSDVVAGTDPASDSIKLSLANQIKILSSDSSYPMQDPYNPTIGFNTRMSDTLSALDSARSGIS